MPTFSGPTYRLKYGRPNDLWFVGLTRAKTVVKKNGQWRAIESPHEDFLATCQLVLRGGYVNEISDDVAAELSAAGFGNYVVED